MPGDVVSDVARDEVVRVVARAAAEREGLADGFTGLLEGLRSQLPTAEKFVLLALVDKISPMWYGILFKEPNPYAGSRPSDIIGLYR